MVVKCFKRINVPERAAKLLSQSCFNIEIVEWLEYLRLKHCRLCFEKLVVSLDETFVEAL